MVTLTARAAETHPVSLQHILKGKHATEYIRVRPGAHIPTIYGMLWHIFRNDWEDKEFIRQRGFGMDDIHREVEKWPPDEVERVTGLKEAQVKRIAEIFAKQRPSTLIWAMGQTQYSFGTANVRTSCILLLATGNVGSAGSDANIFRCNRPRPSRSPRTRPPSRAYRYRCDRGSRR